MIPASKKRNYALTILLVILYIGVFYSCKKYKDPAPVNDPSLTNPYCNDPLAVNYNVGFPGKPDNTKCIYPSDLFNGNYRLVDSIWVTSSKFLVAADSFDINISRTADTNKAKVAITGFCGGGITLLFTASAAYVATSDSTIGDSTTAHIGQQFCHVYDTVTGTITRDRVNDSILYFDFKIYSDTTTYSLQGIAIKK